MLPIVINLLLAIHVIVSLLIILLVLMQRPKNEGLGAAFGGGMTDNLFGAQTTNVLQTITRWLGGIFFGLTLLLSYLYVKQTHRQSSVQQILTAPTVAPPAAATPAPAEPPSDAIIPPTAPEPGPIAPAEVIPTPTAIAPAPTPAATPAKPSATPKTSAPKAKSATPKPERK